MSKILLATYNINVTQDKVCQILDALNPDHTFIELFNQYCEEIFKNIHVIRKSRQHKQALTMPNFDPENLKYKRQVNESEREIYGYFRAGVSDDKYDIEDDTSRSVKFKVDPNIHTSYKNIFFYLNVPENSTEGFLILQRIENFGIKTRVEKSLHLSLKDKIKNGFKFKISNKIPTKALERMLEGGILKDIEFIEETIPGTYEEYYTGTQKSPKKKGKIKTILSTEGGFTQDWKTKIVNLFSGTDSSVTRLSIPELEKEYDEISFNIEFNKKKTKFHVINRDRIQPIVDVTHLVDLDDQGEPTIESLKRESKELANNILILKSE